MINTLPEISEAEATGDIAALYDEIRATSGSPLVNYIWRHLATIEGAARWAWELTRSNDSSRLARDLALHAGAVANHVADGVKLEPGISLCDKTRKILKIYNKNNPANLARIMLIRSGLTRTADFGSDGSGRARRSPPVHKPADVLPPLPYFSDVSAREYDLIERIVLAGPSANVGIIPSLWRHLTIQEGVFEHLTVPLETALASDDFRSGVFDIREKAFSSAARQNVDLPRAIDFDRVNVVESIDRFSWAITELTIAGRLVEIWDRKQDG